MTKWYIYLTQWGQEKWKTFCKQHFLDLELLYFDFDLIEIGLHSQNKQQAIIWNNESLVY